MKITVFKNNKFRVIEVGKLNISFLLKRFDKIKVPLTPYEFSDLSWYPIKKYFSIEEHPVLEGSSIAFGGTEIYIYSPLTDIFVFKRKKAKSLPNNNILQIFQKIALPYVKDYIEAKAHAILDICKQTGRECYIDKDIGVIVKAKKDHNITILSHLDLIQAFYKGFWSNKTLIYDSKTQIVRGALDNTITNAVVIDLLLSGNIPPNVEIVFTNDEEIDMNASAKYARKNKVSYINLDVTNEFKNKSVSIEYDKPNSDTLYALTTLFKGDDVGYTSYRVADDLDSVVSQNLNGLSFCLPTRKTIHSWKNETTLQQIEKYRDLLKKLLANLPTFKKQNLNKISKNVLSCSSANGMIKLSPIKKKKNKFIPQLFDEEYLNDGISFILNDLINSFPDKLYKCAIEELELAIKILIENDGAETTFLSRISKRIFKFFTKTLAKYGVTKVYQENDVEFVKFLPDYLVYFI